MSRNAPALMDITMTKLIANVRTFNYKECSIKCSTCNGVNSCTSCAGNRLNKIPLCNLCPDGYYDSNSSA